VRHSSQQADFSAGCAFERQEFMKLVASTQSAALRHLFFAERLAAKVDGLKEKPGPLKQVGIIGAGLMGGGIAMNFIQKGVPVVMIDAKQEWLEAGMKKVAGLYAAQVKKKKMPQQKMDGLMKLLQPSLDYAALRGCDLVIEAVPEIMSLKKDIFAKLDANTKPECILASNTSTLDIDEVAAVVKDPSRVVGCHFFSPANVMRLLENVRGKHSSPKAIATAMAMGKFIGKVPILVGNCDGFVGNRMLFPYMGESRMLMEDGLSVQDCEAAALKFGMAMGPCSLGDLAGHEIGYKIRQNMTPAQLAAAPNLGPNEVGDWLVEKGRFGLKTPDKSIGAHGRGYFIYKGKTKTLDAEVVAKIAEVQKTKGITPRKVSREEATERLFYCLINEGFKILEEGFAARPSDIDICFIFGYGWPPATGGPMFFAEKVLGLPKLLEKLKVYDAQNKQRVQDFPVYGKPGVHFEPSKLLEACVAQQKPLAEVLKTWKPGASKL
jgi:3-hydroxyacyl-CoA dehydrogenase